MPYVQRTNGVVTGVFVQLQPGIAEEYLADDNTEVVAFDTPVLTATPLQVRRVLRDMGLLATVEAMVAASSDDVKDAWEYASEFRSDSALIASLAAQLDPPLDAAAIRQLIETARSLPSL